MLKKIRGMKNMAENEEGKPSTRRLIEVFKADGKLLEFITFFDFKTASKASENTMFLGEFGKRLPETIAGNTIDQKIILGSVQFLPESAWEFLYNYTSEMVAWEEKRDKKLPRTKTEYVDADGQRKFIDFQQEIVKNLNILTKPEEKKKK
ncbi:MAG: hypothetical protein EAX96_06375 [Candidatus Lokiarchaeota archaeon]|nr:hypothetical protein [Candidatus Lokiarchaeota archaeon]